MSSFSGKAQREHVTFKDIVSGNVSEDVLRASSVTPSQEKVYELERIDGFAQTDPLPAVFIPPVTFFSLPADSIQRLRDEATRLEALGSPAGESVDLEVGSELEPKLGSEAKPESEPTSESGTQPAAPSNSEAEVEKKSGSEAGSNPEPSAEKKSSSEAGSNPEPSASNPESMFSFLFFFVSLMV